MVYHSDGSVVPYVPTSVDRNHAAAFWDMEHTTGSDLKVHPAMKAVLTVNRYTKIRDIIQAAWRLRQLHAGQTVRFAILSEDREFMVAALKEFFIFSDRERLDGPSFPLGKLLLYLKLNEASTLADLNFRSVKALTRSLMIDKILDSMVNQEEQGLASLKSVYRVVSSFFESPRLPQIHDRYGLAMKETRPTEFLKKDAENLFEPRKEHFSAWNGLKKSIYMIIAKAQVFLRQKVLAPVLVDDHGHEYDNEIEVESEHENEVETNVETDVDVQFFDGHQDFIKSLLVWHEDAFRKGDYFVASDDNLAKPVLDLSKVHPIVRMNTVVHGFPALQNKFSDKLHASLNVFPIFQHGSEFKPFGFNQGPIHDLVIVLKGHGGLKEEDIVSMTLVTRDEAQMIGHWLRGGVVSGEKVLLYQFGNGFVHFSEDQRYLSALQSNRHFVMLLMQAKVVAARTKLTHREKNRMRHWFGSATNGQAICQFFKTRILEYKYETMRRWPGSDFQQVCHTVGFFD